MLLFLASGSYLYKTNDCLQQPNWDKFHTNKIPLMQVVPIVTKLIKPQIWSLKASECTVVCYVPLCRLNHSSLITLGWGGGPLAACPWGHLMVMSSWLNVVGITVQNQLTPSISHGLPSDNFITAHHHHQKAGGPLSHYCILTSPNMHEKTPEKKAQKALMCSLRTLVVSWINGSWIVGWLIVKGHWIESHFSVVSVEI